VASGRLSLASALGSSAAHPGRLAWHRLAAGLAFAFACGAAAVHLWQRADGAWYDAEVRGWRALARPVAAEPIALIAVDETSLAQSPLSVAYWQPQLAALVMALHAAKARVVAIDLVLPERRTTDGTGAPLDLALLAALARTHEDMPVILAQTAMGDLHAGVRTLRPIFAPYVEIVGMDRIGNVLLPLDRDGVARRLPAFEMPSFSEQVARSIKAVDRAASGRQYNDFRIGEAIPVFSAADVLTRITDASWLAERFAGRIVVIGAVLPFDDRISVPWDPTGAGGDLAPGIAVQGQAIRSWLAPNALRAAPPAVAWLLIGIAAVLPLLRREHHSARGWLIALALLAVWLAVAAAGLMIGYVLPVFGAIYATLASTVFVTTLEGIDAWRERLRLEKVFGGYVSPAVFRRLMEGQIDTRSRSIESCAYLFADIRSFTTWSERIGAERALELLNRYYTDVAAIVHHAGGTVDDFRGDGLMAFFGAPEPLPDPVSSAEAAARAMLAHLPAINRDLEAAGLPAIAIGIGLASGAGVVGHVGSRDRYHYTVIGRGVNLAARLEALCAPLGIALLASAEFARSAPERWRPMGKHDLKGFGPIEVFGGVGESSAS